MRTMSKPADKSRLAVWMTIPLLSPDHPMSILIRLSVQHLVLPAILAGLYFSRVRLIPSRSKKLSEIPQPPKMLPQATSNHLARSNRLVHARQPRPSPFCAENELHPPILVLGVRAVSRRELSPYPDRPASMPRSRKEQRKQRSLRAGWQLLGQELGSRRTAFR